MILSNKYNRIIVLVSLIECTRSCTSNRTLVYLVLCTWFTLAFLTQNPRIQLKQASQAKTNEQINHLFEPRIQFKHHLLRGVLNSNNNNNNTIPPLPHFSVRGANLGRESSWQLLN